MEKTGNKNQYLLIDICGTMFRSNTTMDFFKYYFSEETWYKRIERIKNNRFLAIFCYLIQRFTYYDFIRTQMIKHLRGFGKKDIYDMCEKFYQEYLSKKINKEVIDVIEYNRKIGRSLILVSATLDGIANVVASNMNIDVVISSELEYKDGTCSGRYRNELLGRKMKELTQVGIEPEYSGVITDNFSDMELIGNSVDKWVVVTPKTEKRWMGLLKDINNVRIIKTLD